MPPDPKILPSFQAPLCPRRGFYFRIDTSPTARQAGWRNNSKPNGRIREDAATWKNASAAFSRARRQRVPDKIASIERAATTALTAWDDVGRVAFVATGPFATGSAGWPHSA